MESEGLKGGFIPESSNIEVRGDLGELFQGMIELLWVGFKKDSMEGSRVGQFQQETVEGEGCWVDTFNYDKILYDFARQWYSTWEN